MKSLVFFDDAEVSNLYPLTLTRPAAGLRAGILTIAEKWARLLGCQELGYRGQAHLSEVFTDLPDAEVLINGRLLPNAGLIEKAASLLPGEKVLSSDGLLLMEKPGDTNTETIWSEAIRLIRRPYDLFALNHEEICSDFEWITRGRESAPLGDDNRVIGPHPVFLEPGAKAYCSIFNTTDGPIYLAADSEVMEGCMVRGPFSLGEHSQLRMGARIYTGTSIGPHCRIGGEVSNSVVQGFSNKGHEGYLGNSVIGAWCNIGADSNNSNLKNNYDEVKLWNYRSGRFDKTGLQFCGLIMGDHSKCGINTMFNTGTVVGVACNVFGAGFPRNFIPDFAWGGASGFVTYRANDALQTARRVMARRKITPTEADENLLRDVFYMTAEGRFWERSES